MADLPLVLFTGSRNWPHYLQVFEVARLLQELLGPYRLMHGAARGLDIFAGVAAKVLGLIEDPNPVTPHEWATYGPIAGNRRNTRMLEKQPDYVVAFWTGVKHGPLKSTGTIDTVDKAVNSYRIPVLMYTLK